MNVPARDPHSTAAQWVQIAFLALAVLMLIHAVVATVTSHLYLQEQAILVGGGGPGARDAALTRMQSLSRLRFGSLSLFAVLSAMGFALLAFALPKRRSLAWLAAVISIFVPVLFMLQGFIFMWFPTEDLKTVAYVSYAVAAVVDLLQVSVLGLVLAMTFPYLSSIGTRAGAVVMIGGTTLVMLGLSLIAVVTSTLGLDQSPLFHFRVTQVAGFVWALRALSGAGVLFVAGLRSGTVDRPSPALVGG